MASTEFIALVTGANSGLGSSIVTRLCSDFIASYPESHKLTIIFTTRSASKGAAALTGFLAFASKLPRNAHLRISFTSVQVDLTNLRSVISLAKHLNANFSHLDVAVLNAGLGGFTGINWGLCFLRLAQDWVKAVTYPEYKIQTVGSVVSQPGADEKIGEIFCANVFGHYYLAHELMPLLRAGGAQTEGADAGRIIWVSSLEAYNWSFNREDLQGIKATHAYECSKRLADILAMSSESSFTVQYTKSFFATDDIRHTTTEQKPTTGTGKVKTYSAHPGICATAIIELHIVLFWGMTMAFYIARLLGSPWHTISTTNGAASMSFLALASDDELEHRGATHKKWGSTTTLRGQSGIMPTDVEGENTEDWEDDARAAWQEMENLRKHWKKMLEN